MSTAETTAEVIEQAAQALELAATAIAEPPVITNPSEHTRLAIREYIHWHERYNAASSKAGPGPWLHTLHILALRQKDVSEGNLAYCLYGESSEGSFSYAHQQFQALEPSAIVRYLGSDWQAVWDHRPEPKGFPFIRVTPVRPSADLLDGCQRVLKAYDAAYENGGATLSGEDVDFIRAAVEKAK